MTEPRTPSRNPLRNPRSPYPSPNEVPQAPRRRPSEERAEVAASARTATQLAVLAIVIAGIALGLAVWRTVAGTGSGCQSTVWSAEPDANRLPANWTVRGTTFDTNRRSTTFAGQDPGDGSGAPNVLATVTCLPDGASEALSRAAAAARGIGQVVGTKDDLSDGGFEATDGNSGAIFLEFRRGDILVDLMASGGATATDIETVASAYDRALGGDGGSIASPEPSSSDSAGPSASDGGSGALSHDAPELEKLLPTKVGSLQLTVASQLGSAALSEGEPAAVALAAQGKQPDDLHLAQAAAYNDSGDPVLGVTAISVTGLDAAKVRVLTMDYFSMTGSAVKQSTVTLAGKPWTKFDLGDGGLLYYLRAQGDVVLVITTADATLAEQAAAAIH